MRVYRRGNGPINFVQIYGERNSGTTYLAKLLQDSLRVPPNLLGMQKSDETPLGSDIFGYKHWFPNWKKLTGPAMDQTLFVVIYRNPLTWIRAMMARPYALSQSISGRSVEELSSIKLVGHINGKNTTNELHPDSGKKLTIFELRESKIQGFEALKSTVHNIAYVNLEELLDDPSLVIQRLNADFGSAFSTSLNLGRAPYKSLDQEYRSPERFSKQEEDILSKSINWSEENSIGYRKNGCTVKGDKSTPFIILHGSSSVGKTHIINSISKTLDNIIPIEMDDCKYWEDREPTLDPEKLLSWLPHTSSRDFIEFLRSTIQVTPEGKQCIEFLMRILRDHESWPRQSRGDAKIFISTCGALPRPKPLEDASIYRWISDHLQISFHHILIEIPPEVHTARMTKRKRSHLKDEILENYSKRLRDRELHDAVISNSEGVEEYIRGLSRQKGDFRPPRSRSAKKFHKKAQQSNLEYIQIYGERNSGTNYLRRLISDTMRDPENVLGSYATKKDPRNGARLIGYKHYYPRLEKLADFQNKTLFLVIYKNPYTWIRSMLSKPYHFRATLEGKAIVELPGLKLRGIDVHGREIPDKHPDTGAQIDIFALRKFKILRWNDLIHQVDNIVYINYEDLLLFPAEISQRVVEQYPTLFERRDVSDHVSNPEYVKKYLTPEPFSDADMSVLNANIDWGVESLAGYEIDNLFISPKSILPVPERCIPASRLDRMRDI